MNINFDEVADRTIKVHTALADAIVNKDTNVQLLADLALALDGTSRRLMILANGNKMPKAEAAGA